MLSSSMLKLWRDAPLFGRLTVTSVFAGIVSEFGWNAMSTIVTVCALPPADAAGVAAPVSGVEAAGVASSSVEAAGVAAPSGGGVAAPAGTLSDWTTRQTPPCGFAKGS